MRLGAAVSQQGSSLALRFGSTAVARLVANAAVRKVVFAGVAFGAGYQLSRALRSRQLPEWVSSARDVYRTVNDHDPQAEGRLAGRWVRESFTLISSVYNVVDRKKP
jgi:hypothetical protein